MNVVGYGGGTNSTAMLIGLWQRRIPVDLILFADPGGEQPHGYDQETFKLKVDFTFATTVDLHVNGDPNSYQTDTFKKGVYSSNLASISASDALKDDSACESVELEFNVNDFQYLEFSYSWNLGHRYYINDQKIPLEENDHYGTSSNGRVRTFKLTMVK